MAETRRVKLTKRLLWDALLELLAQQPLAKITVTDVCRLADVNRCTFYVYYSSVQQLLQEIEAHILDQIPVSPVIPTAASSEVFLQLLTTFFEYVRCNEQLFRTLVLRPDDSSFCQRLIENVLVKYHQSDIIQDTLPARYRYVYCVNGVIGLLREWLDWGFPMDSRHFASLVLQLSLQVNDFQPEQPE